MMAVNYILMHKNYLYILSDSTCFIFKSGVNCNNGCCSSDLIDNTLVQLNAACTFLHVYLVMGRQTVKSVLNNLFYLIILALFS